MTRSSFNPLFKVGLLLCATVLTLTACAPTLSRSVPLNAATSPTQLNAQSQNIQSQALLQSRFITTETAPSDLFKNALDQAQAYSDLISKRRDLDLFKLHSQAVGLKVNENSYIFSILGTAATRNDLNVELRALVGQNTGMNLNYSGPVTRGTSTASIKTTEHSSAPSRTAAKEALNFELITGLPPEHITSSYGDQLDRLERFLRYRFQAQAMTFDDGPLIYALTTPQDQLLGFVFFNQRNILTLGERKYADVQSVVLIDTQGAVQGAYTIIAFNPKTAQANSTLSYQIEAPENLGQLALLGDF